VKDTPIIVRVTGTTPLSFNVKPGSVLTVKKYSPSASNRPTVGSKFKSDAYIVFKGITKVGRLSDSAISKLQGDVPAQCVVYAVDEVKKVLSVEFKIGDASA
jgi:hypothetical protein